MSFFNSVTQNLRGLQKAFGDSWIYFLVNSLSPTAALQPNLKVFSPLSRSRIT